MPRPNPRRPIGGESGLARRIAYEREQREWTMEGLASRMTAAGCPINQSAIWKIENADPPRRITYDEALAFAEVFGMPLSELSIPPELAADKRARDLIDEYQRALSGWVEAFFALAHHLRRHPATLETLKASAVWVQFSADPLRADYEQARGAIPQ